ncbi:hypothetical protein [Tsukamurella tyrosinosolvens]|uniref:hypothetical protein n=1 Tax=Tsukamurella tyrosinosolvens TaxID=57704 RepID=UPI001114A8D2|nr:hypothetical protein [Tsukamurella tyrosinosolvens]
MSANIEITTQLRSAQINTELGPFWHASDVARVAGLSRVAPIPRGGASVGNGLLPRYLRVLIHRGYLDDPAVAQLADGDLLISPKAARPLILLIEGEPGVTNTAAIEDFFAARDVQLPVIPDVPDDPCPVVVPEPATIDQPAAPAPAAPDTAESSKAPELEAEGSRPFMHTYGSYDGVNDIDYLDFDGQRWLRAGPLCAAYEMGTAGNLAGWLQRRSDFEFQYTRPITHAHLPDSKDPRHRTRAICLSRDGAQLALARVVDAHPEQAEHVQSTVEVLAEMWDDYGQVQEEDARADAEAAESDAPAPEQEPMPAVPPADDASARTSVAVAPATAPFAVPPAAVPPPALRSPAPAAPAPITRAEFDELRLAVRQMQVSYGAISGMVDSANAVKRSLDGATTQLRRELLERVESAVGDAIDNPERRLESAIADHLHQERERTGALLVASERSTIRRAVEAVVQLLGGVDPDEVEQVLIDAGVSAGGPGECSPAESKDAITLLASNAHERDVLIALCKSGPLHEEQLREALKSRGRRKLPETLFNLNARGIIRRDAHNLWIADLSSVHLGDDGGQVAIAN